MELIGDFVFFTQGPKLLSFDLESQQTKTHVAHSDEIISLTQSNNILYSGGRDGLIIKWSLPSLTSFKINSPIKLLASSPDSLYFLKSNTLILYKLDLTSDTYHQSPFFKGLLGDALNLKLNSNYTNIILLKTRSVIILNILTQNPRIYEHNAPLTVISIHPQDKYIAIGDCTGQIIKIYDTNNSKMHWHAHKVTSLIFTNDGNFMISGGEEGVAVLWHESTNEKTFLPRLGTIISEIAVSKNNDLYIIKLIDGSVKVFRTSDYKQIGAYVKLISPKITPGGQVYTGIVWNQKTMVLNGAPGFLQFYEPESGKIDFFDCEGRNPICRSNEEYPNPLHVIQVAFNDIFMATLQISDSKYMKISQLKFWKDHKVNTLIMHPQSDTSHKLFNYQNAFVTLGKSSFVLWEFNQQWKGSIERHRQNLPCLAYCASDNLYVSFGHIITEWNQQMECIKEVYEPNSKHIQHLQRSGTMLIAGTESSIHIYLDDIILWSLELEFIHGIIANGDHFIVGLNASKYTPHDIRAWRTNILLKFSYEKNAPEKIYKVDSPLAFSLYNENVVILDKFFEYVNLDHEKTLAHDLFPEIKKYEEVDKKRIAMDQKKGDAKLISRYIQSNELKWLNNVNSHELPSSEEFFKYIIEASSKGYE